ncbi:MAG: SBBP repeat-containing protein [Candidatus Syntrophosphaera sp.]
MRFLFILLGIILFIPFCGLSAQNPEWMWAVRGGGTEGEYGNQISTDPDGNVFVTGWFYSGAGFGATDLASNGENDIFVAKLDPGGNWLWATSAGGTSNDYSEGVATDGSGNIYIAGSFRETVTFGSTTLSADYNDVFVAKLDPEGNWLWATSAGGSLSDYALDIAVDTNGNCFVTGGFEDVAEFGSTILTVNPEDTMGRDIFIAKLDTDGNWLWARRAGGADPDDGKAITCDSDGNCYVTGVFYDLQADFGADIFNDNEADNVFISKLSSGGAWLWTTRATGIWPCYSYGAGICLDSSGNVCLTGFFNETITFGSTTLTCQAFQDIYIAKLSGSGDWLWVTQAGLESYNEGTGIVTDPSGNIFVTGYFYGSADFGDDTLTSSGVADIFVTALSPGGNWLWARGTGSSDSDSGYGIAAGSGGAVFVTGHFRDKVDFGQTTLVSSGMSDVFVAKMNTGGVGIEESHGITPPDLGFLSNAWPNPLYTGDQAHFEVKLPCLDRGTLRIFNLRGQLIATYRLDPGKHTIEHDFQGNAPGIYLYQLETQNQRVTKKLILLK